MLRFLWCWLPGLLLLAGQPLFAQQQAVKIQGTILDSLDQPLVGATVILMHAQDSLMESFALADDKGHFLVQTTQPDQYLLQITYVGYGTFVRALEITAGQPDVQFGAIRLNPDAITLADVTVKDSFIPIVIKNDTIEYTADAFKTPPNAVVEDLLKKLPGIQVEQDGTIKAQGEEVQNVLVDGKPFFEDDAKVATRNIPADIVNKVQVFDQKSDFTEFTGIEDGQEEKTINLTIKDGKNKGTFGRVEGAYGLDERYKAAGNINRFNKKMQLSVIGNSNNINEQAFSFQEYLNFMGGLEDLMSGGELDADQFPVNLLDNSGETRAKSGGINFNYDFPNKTDLRSTYFYSDSDNQTQTDSELRNLLGSGFYNTENSGLNRSRIGNHSLRLRLKKAIDDSQDLLFKGNAALIQNRSQRLSDVGSSLGGLALNASDQFNNSHLEGLNWDSQLTYRKKLSKKGRFLTLEGRFGGQNSLTTSNLLSANRFFTEPILTDTTAQQQTTDIRTTELEGTLNYVEPLAKNHFLKLDLSSRYLQNARQKDFFDWQYASEYLYNEDISNRFDRTVNESIAGTSYKYVRKDFNLSAGVDLQQTRLLNTLNNSNTPLQKTFYNWLPNAQWSYAIGSNENLRMRYNAQVRVPGPEQLQPAIDNSDPLNIYQGNPDLQPELIHQLNLNYNKFNQFFFRAFFMGINAQWMQNRIINTVQIDDQLQRFIRPENVQQEWQVNSYYSFEAPIPGSELKGSLDGNLRFQRSNLLINEQLDGYQLWDIRQSLRLENRSKDKIDLAATYTLGFLGTFFPNSPTLDLPFANHTFELSSYWYPAKSWSINCTVSHQRFTKTELETEGWTNTLLDAGIQKTFKDNQWSLYLKGINLLDQELLYQRNSLGNQFFINEKNRLGRVFQLGLRYKIRSFGQ
ncbi:MAG: TonB-dependent receptor [Phaeodactylibacter sp.]|nr:TonB-dependent receptor [Phaeodactylibacter sp.]